MTDNKFTATAKKHGYRRLIHLSMGLTPILYYWYRQAIADFFHLSDSLILLIIAVAASIFEILRIHRGWLLFSQRDYERHYPSALFWSVIGIICVLYLTPMQGYKGAAFGLPIIWSMCVGDPLLGECRRANLPSTITLLIAYIALYLIWLFSSLWLGTPLWLTLIMPVIAIAAEWWPLRYIDDNFMMLIAPLLFIKIFY